MTCCLGGAGLAIHGTDSSFRTPRTASCTTLDGACRVADVSALLPRLCFSAIVALQRLVSHEASAGNSHAPNSLTRLTSSTESLCAESISGPTSIQPSHG